MLLVAIARTMRQPVELRRRVLKRSCQPNVVREYTRLYAVFFGLVSQPHPRGALRPSEWRMYRLIDVRAAMLLRSEGLRNPNLTGCPI